MINLTIHTSTDGPPEVKIEGRLEADNIQSLLDLLGGLPRHTTLDLASLTSIDHAGISLLIRLRKTGTALRNRSLYINQLLEEA